MLPTSRSHVSIISVADIVLRSCIAALPDHPFGVWKDRSYALATGALHLSREETLLGLETRLSSLLSAWSLSKALVACLGCGGRCCPLDNEV